MPVNAAPPPAVVAPAPPAPSPAPVAAPPASEVAPARPAEPRAADPVLARSPGPEARAGGETRLWGEVFARYGHERWGDQTARAFDLPRARLGADAEPRGWFGARVLLETARSAAPGSLYGVDGDSIVLRAREIYGEARLPLPLPTRLRLGLVPTLAVTPLEVMWGRRVVAPTAQEASGFLSPADLGAAALVELPRKVGEVAVAATNGEGFTQHEQNEGKTLQARLWLAPVDWLLPEGLSLKALLHAERGSLGPGQTRADRYVGGVSAEFPLGALGLDGTFAEGVYGNPAQKGRTASGWLRVGPIRGFEALGRVDQIDPDRRQNGASDRVTAWQGGVGFRPEPRGPSSFEVFASYRRSSGGVLASASDPGLPRRGLRLDLRVSF